MRLTRETLQFASTVGAEYVVLHLGAVHLFLNHDGTHELQRMARHGLIGTVDYAHRKGELVRKRMRLAPIYYERAREALLELAPIARKLGIVLGVEGRSHFEQVPSELEMLQLMEEFQDEPAVRYWHDFGHIQRKHNLLLLNHDQYLAGLKPYLFGAHVNDALTIARPPCAISGGVDFESLVPRYFTRRMPLTWEISSSVRREDIIAAKARWDRLMPKVPE